MQDRGEAARREQLGAVAELHDRLSHAARGAVLERAGDPALAAGVAAAQDPDIGPSRSSRLGGLARRRIRGGLRLRRGLGLVGDLWHRSGLLLHRSRLLLRLRCRLGHGRSCELGLQGLGLGRLALLEGHPLGVALPLGRHVVVCSSWTSVP